MAKKKKLKIKVSVDSELERLEPLPDFKTFLTERRVTLEFQGLNYHLTIGDTLHVQPRLRLAGHFQSDEIPGIDLPVRVVAIQ